jgi:FKBP-type peptidyl-prolyl cis-trans isomerase SlyD
MASQVGPGTVVTVRYRVLDAEGEVMDASDPDLPPAFVFGYGELLPALERALDGKRAGDSVTVSVGPEEAFGRRDPNAVLEIDREDFPADVTPGDCFEAEGEGGEVVLLKVLDVSPDAVVVDLNHPLADQEVRFDLEVLAVRPAEAAELAEAEERLSSELGGSASPLLSPERLLKGGGKRYENTPRRLDPNGGKVA